MTNEILLEVFKSVSLLDLSNCTFEYFNYEDYIAINAMDGGRVIDAIMYDNIFHMLDNSGNFNPLNPQIDAFRIAIPLLDHEEFLDACNEAMYCTSCQALEEHDCFCNFELNCPYCGGQDDVHSVDCIYNYDPFDNLLRDGYD